MKTAEEMFKELWFNIKRSDTCLFYKVEDGSITIIFNLKSKTIRIVEEHCIDELGLYEYLAIDCPITVELHKAIHKQMEELGWL